MDTMEPVFIIGCVYLGLLVIVGVLTYNKVRNDKRAAERGEWRTSECALHTWEFFGGYLGSFLAQRIFRHKIKKAGYQIQFWIIVAAHVCGIYYVCAYRNEINDIINNSDIINGTSSYQNQTN